MLASPLPKIFQAAREVPTPIRVSGLEGSSRAWFLLRCLQEFSRPVIVVCPDEEIAQALQADCEALCERVFDLRGHFVFIPGWERPASSSISPSLRTRHARAAGLRALLQDCSNSLIFTTRSGLFLRTLSQNEWRNHSLDLEVGGAPLARETLVSSLIAGGYLRSDTVEDPGTFAVRGELIDIFQPGEDYPYRIEFFDDVIERIRPFDPSSQRTLSEQQPLSRLLVSPCRETLITSESKARLRERLKTIADECGVPRSTRDPILETISLGGYPERSDFWAGIASATPSTLMDHLPKNPLWVEWDDLACDQGWDQLLTNEKEGLSHAVENGFIIPALEDLYELGPESSHLHFRSRCSFVLQPVALTEAADLAQEGPSSSYRVAVKPNSDLLSQQSGTRLDNLTQKLRDWLGRGLRVLICSPTPGQSERLSHLLSGRGIQISNSHTPGQGELTLAVCGLSSGFRWASEGWAILTESEALGDGRVGPRRTANKKRSDSSNATDWAGIQALSDLQPGDLVVHQDHGIGRYLGIIRVSNSGASSDFLQIEYAQQDKLYLPVYRMNVIQKHGAAAGSIPLDRLGSVQFQKTKDRVKESVKKLAIDLIKLYAERSIQTGYRYSGRDAALEEFEARFPHEETPDQTKAIDDIIEDLASGKIMDRLICGDVGYGKTEVAIRAAFRVATDGKQVAVLVPTTLLAHQHEQSFRSRLAGMPLIVESLSRFKSSKEQKDILRRVSEGKVDILIGTHRLLSKDVSFHDLGLLVVDEEHRFGVEHKEKIKALRTNIPVLTLTATPIPRTLHMALSGLREISLIRTPPIDRLPIRTLISKQDDAVIKRAIDFELGRGGQVFYLYNRVQSIFEAATAVQRLCPNARVSVAHGQMPENELEQTVRDFYEKKNNVLVCTSIIESGIDLPSANTILIHRADTFGLAQLYQIRGRVGRGQHRGYAYLLVPNDASISEDAKKRLDVIQRFVELGSGFNVASHDLDIRGGGDLLGPQQSGNILAVGFDLYLGLLEEAIQELRQAERGGTPSAPQPEPEPEIKSPFSSFLPESFVPDVHHRLALYRRLSACKGDDEVDSLEAELIDRFGPLPEEASSLLWLIRVKVHLKRLKVDAITVGPERVVLSPGKNSSLDPVRAIALVSGHPGQYSFTPESRFVARCSARSMKELYFVIQDLLKNLTPAQSVAKAPGER